jgi:hypothetical protein
MEPKGSLLCSKNPTKKLGYICVSEVCKVYMTDALAEVYCHWLDLPLSMFFLLIQAFSILHGRYSPILRNMHQDSLIALLEWKCSLHQTLKKFLDSLEV